MGWSLDFLLQCLQMALFVGTFLCGILSCMSMGWTSRILAGQCPLYGAMQFSKSDLNDSLTLDSGTSVWGNPRTCDYVTYSCAFAAIYAVIWFWFYILVSDWKYNNLKQLITDAADDGPPPDMRLFGPSIITNIVMLGIILASAGISTAGRDHWCQEVEKTLAHILRNRKECSFLDGVLWTNLPNGENIYNYMRTSVITSWILVAMLFSKLVLIIYRFHRYSKVSNLAWSFLFGQTSDMDLLHKGDPEEPLDYEGFGYDEDEIGDEDDDDERNEENEEFGEMTFMKGREPDVVPSEPKEAESLLNSPKRTNNDQFEFSTDPS